MQRRLEPDPFLGVLTIIAWMVIAVIAAVIVVVYMTGCERPVDPPVVLPDAGELDDTPCGRAGARLEALGCVPSAVCSESDCDDFEARCEALERDFPGYVDAPCLAAAESCEAVNACAD